MNTWIEQIVAESRVRHKCLMIALPYMPIREAHKAANEAKQQLVERFTNDTKSNQNVEEWIVDTFREAIEETYVKNNNPDYLISWR